MGEFYQIFREELTPTRLKLLKKIAEDGTLSNPFSEPTITLMTKPDENTTK